MADQPPEGGVEQVHRAQRQRVAAGKVAGDPDWDLPILLTPMASGLPLGRGREEFQGGEGGGGSFGG